MEEQYREARDKGEREDKRSEERKWGNSNGCLLTVEVSHILCPGNALLETLRYSKPALSHTLLSVQLRGEMLQKTFPSDGRKCAIWTPLSGAVAFRQE